MIRDVRVDDWTFGSFRKRIAFCIRSCRLDEGPGGNDIVPRRVVFVEGRNTDAGGNGKGCLYAGGDGSSFAESRR